MGRDRYFAAGSAYLSDLISFLIKNGGLWAIQTVPTVLVRIKLR
jgi:hypothetical protein